MGNNGRNRWEPLILLTCLHLTHHRFTQGWGCGSCPLPLLAARPCALSLVRLAPRRGGGGGGRSHRDRRAHLLGGTPGLVLAASSGAERGTDHHETTTTTTTTTVSTRTSGVVVRAPSIERRSVLSCVAAGAAAALTGASGIWPASFGGTAAVAAPPIAIIAEELGYFPITNAQGDTVYVPKKVQRASSAQAVQLAEYLTSRNVVWAGTYWCPHTSRQRELLGREAASKLRYVECSPRGYGSDPKWCLSHRVDGYPAWIFPDGRQVSGERPLSDLAREANYPGTFDESLEEDLPPLIGSGACSLKK